MRPQQLFATIPHQAPFVNAMGSQMPVVALIFICYGLLRLCLFHPDFFTGVDLFWHVAYGDYVIEHGALPAGDWLTWTFDGHPYQVTQWLGQVLLALSFSAGGSFGLTAITTAAGMATLFFAWRTASLYLHNPLIALCLALFTVFPTLFLNVRPQNFGVLAFSVLVWLMAVWFERKERWALVGMPVVMALWANLHGSFMVGVVFIAAVGGGAWLFTLAEMKCKFWASVQAHGPLAIASFAAVFAVLLNPYGWDAFKYVLEISQLKTTTSGVISEWAATSWATHHGSQFFIIVFAMVSVLALGAKRPCGPLFLGFLGAVYFGLQADRQTMMAVIALVPLFAWAVKNSDFDLKIERRMVNTVALWKAALLILAMVWAALAIHKAIAEPFKAEFLATYPVKALDYLDEHKIEGKLFHNLHHGGYVAYRGRKAFGDGRLDLFGDDFAFGTDNAVNGKAGWQKFIDKYKPDLFLLNNEDVLVEHLLKTNKCQYTYLDKHFSVVRCDSV